MRGVTNRFGEVPPDFPSFSEGLSLRDDFLQRVAAGLSEFPFLFGGTFIEGLSRTCHQSPCRYFPSFSEGLSLRGATRHEKKNPPAFPFLFGGTFIEGGVISSPCRCGRIFPFLFGGTFIEGPKNTGFRASSRHFPSFSEGLSLRAGQCVAGEGFEGISLPFRRDFH